MPIVGFLGAASPDQPAIIRNLVGFREGLSEAGQVDGQNVAIEYRWAEGQYDRLPALAADLVARKVNVVIAGGGTVTARAAQAATSTIPIVFMGGGDPVKDGLIKSLNHPGGNITGVNQFASELIAKRLELLREMVPKVAAIGTLTNPTNPNSEPELRDLQAAATALGCVMYVASATTEREIEAALERIVAHRAGALVVGTDALFVSRRAQVTSLAARHVRPASYTIKEYTEAGGLMSYGANRADLWRQVGVYAGRILKGESAADLPVLQPTKFELVINLKTAKALGLTVPQSLLARADEIIE
jgi:putative ABC transport system substrate-binding protein